MKDKNLLKNIHPGEIRGAQSITPAMALKLASYFKTSEKFWLGLQTSVLDKPK